MYCTPHFNKVYMTQMDLNHGNHGTWAQPGALRAHVHGPTRLAMGGHGWLWQAMTGHGWSSV